MSEHSVGSGAARPAPWDPAPWDPVPGAPRRDPGVPRRDPAPAPGPSPRSVTFGIALLATTVLVALLAALPAAYVVRGPGPTENTLGSQDGTPLISVSGAPTYETTGELRLTTVSVLGGPGHPASVLDVIGGWLSPTHSVGPVEDVYPRNVTAEQTEKLNQAEMVGSQENATVAALTELGYKVPATLTIAGTEADTSAAEVLRKGDVITSFNGKPVATYQDLLAEIAAVGADQTVTVGVKRAGRAQDVRVTTHEVDGATRLGVFIDPAFQPPVKVTIKIDDIGGPSAGTMFALGIIDKMTPADEAKGVVIAGTGTMDISGAVGPIGGIEQKMVAAKRDRASWFLAPADNCADVVGHIPSGLHVTRVSTLHEARLAVAAIGAGKGSSLPTCSTSR